MNGISRIFSYKVLLVFPVIMADKCLVEKLPVDILAEIVYLTLLY